MKFELEQNSRKALIIAYVFPPIAYAGTYRTLRFCRYLPENGWQTCVLTINVADDLDNDYRLLDRLPRTTRIYRTPTVDFWRMWNKRKKQEESSDSKKSSEHQVPKQDGAKKGYRSFIVRIKAIVWEVLTIPDHMVFWIPFALIKGIWIQIREKYDIVYTSSPPHSEHIIGLLISKIFKLPWVADFRDPMLDSSGYDPDFQIRRWIDRKLENLIVKHASKLLIISDNYKQLMEKRYPGSIQKFITFPNGYDPDTYERAGKETFNKFTILYAGSFYANRNPAFFLQGFSRWLKHKSDEEREKIQILFYGPPSPIAQAIVNEENLSNNVFFKGMIPQDELIPKQKGADLLLLIVGYDKESKGTVTSKIFEYMACRGTIFALMPPGDAADILKTYPRLFLVDREDPELLENKLESAFRHYEKSDKNSVYERSKQESYTSVDRFDARTQTRSLASCFSELVCKYAPKR